MRPFLLVLSAPSGGGKSTIARKLLQARTDVGYSVSATTRRPRPGERDGTDYHFLTRAEFERRVEAGEFLEHATYGGHRYGTLRGEVESIFARGCHAVLDIEVEGARQIRAHLADAVLIFVLPPSAQVLAARLRTRETESEEEIRNRLDRAAAELAAAPEYDYTVVNDDLGLAVEQVAAIMDAEARRVSRQAEFHDYIDGIRHALVDPAIRHAG